MIKVSVNGEVKEIEEKMSVTELVAELGYIKKGFAIAINTTFIAIASYGDTIVNDGDTIDILAPVQGG